MKYYDLEIFDSRNTCRSCTLSAGNYKSAVRKAKKIDNEYPIIVKDSDGYFGDWVKIENGIITEARRLALFDL